jgi:competence protein ComEC
MLDVRILNVGHGDCTFVLLPSGRLMMIDINNSKSLPSGDIDALATHEGVSTYTFRNQRLASHGFRTWEEYYRSLLDDPSDYYRQNFSGRSVFRYIQTHPDMDHMSGLHRFFWQDKVGLENFWNINHNKEMEEGDFENSRYAYIDWLVYEALSHGYGPDANEDPVPRNHKVISPKRGHERNYWSDDNITILSPSEWLEDECKKEESYNNASYVIKIEHAGRSIILPGDAESKAWKSMLNMLDPGALRCDVLKAAHHGRESGYDKDAVNAMNPGVVICSVGKKPSTDASDEYESHGAKVLSTRYNGSIRVRIWDDGDIWITNSKDEMLHAIT